MLAFSGAKRSPSQAPRGAQRHPVREDGSSEQVEGEVQHQHDSLAEES